MKADSWQVLNPGAGRRGGFRWLACASVAWITIQPGAVGQELPATNQMHPDLTTPPPAMTEAERWSSFLPLMKEEALARGHELPLPFGVGFVYNYLEREINVTDVRVGINGQPMQSVSDFLDLGSNSRVNAALLKADAWVLPFLNVYFLGGYLDNQSTSIGHVTVGAQQFDFQVPTSIQGFVGGGGLTLAAGYRNFFLTVDANYTQTDLGFDDSFSALVASVRTGWFGKVGAVPVRLWVGGVFWDTANTASSTVQVTGVGTVQFEADQGPRNPWNASVGCSVVISRSWECFADYGFNLDDVRIFATGLTWRF
jgi:hypothetical protein